ncbi:MAG: citramalate synthase [Omnitrophica bacterium RIFCSPHIGHO2_02_FULL_51_18]|nr:MAG: citramalate synthase [Omnitrophica bacterium RIFCSPHIGHO2_02_FULL_51_18]
MTQRKIQVYDTTLRDGSQSEGISFSVQDKLLVAQRIDELGFHFIEGGWPGANPKDIEFFNRVKKIKLKNSQIVAFGSTRKPHTKASEDDNLRGLIAAETRVITIFGKSWDMHVKEVFKTDLEENIRMIHDSIKFLKSKGKEVVYDAEHFFDGYTHNPSYALKTIQAAMEAGASVLVLCDTNGGSLPSKVGKIVSDVHAHWGHPLGIHTHNDCGVGIANAVAAVEAGVTQVQGTINGFGERCGNPDLLSIVANLQLKLGFSCLAPQKLKEFTEVARFVSEIGNMLLPKNQPYVGQSAFAHKGGVHINAVMKNPETYEHIEPSVVGNRRRFLVSELGGKTNIMLRAQELDIELKKESPETRKILQRVQEKENEGYQYESAEASFELLIREVTGKRKKFFEFKKVEVLAENIADKNPNATAKVRLIVGKEENYAQAEGDGPVNALDTALKKALLPFYPQVQEIHLDDYKVRVVNSEAGTAAKVRVIIESRDDKKIWTTVGVSSNIIDASWEALVDAIEYKLIKPY